jgi:hypothetical protein
MVRFAASLVLIAALVGCGGGGNGGPPPPGNPVPTLTSISPTSAPVGSAEFTLTATGSNFMSSSVVKWGGSNRTTTFVSATQLTATIPATDLATGGTVQVTVFNPSPGGGTSAGKTFSIENPAPTLTSISPTSATAGGAGFTLTVNGSNFISSSVVKWGGSNRTTTYVRSTQLTAAISASDIATAGTVAVTVFNPAPGGGNSIALGFSMTALHPLTITTSRLPDTEPDKVFRFALSAAGGVPPYIWGSPSTNLPGGFQIWGDGSVTWDVEPWAAGTTLTFTASVLDSAAAQNRAERDLSIVVRTAPLGPNDTCTPGTTAGTTQISNGRIRASISPYGDIDVYSFHGTAGAQVTIEIFALRLDLDGNAATRDSQLDSITQLLNGSCSELTFNDDIDPGIIQDSLISNYTLPSTGTYFIVVRDFRGDGRPDLIYELSLSGAD